MTGGAWERGAVRGAVRGPSRSDVFATLFLYVYSTAHTAGVSSLPRGAL